MNLQKIIQFQKKEKKFMNYENDLDFLIKKLYKIKL